MFAYIATVLTVGTLILAIPVAAIIGYAWVWSKMFGVIS